MSEARLYILEFSNGKIYVGITSQRFFKRLSCHRWRAKNGNPAPLYHAWRKHGEPRAVVVFDGTVLEMKQAEVDLIAHFNSMTPGGYNRTPGGDHRICSDETREKMSDALRGRRQSERTRQAISTAMTGVKHTEQHRRNNAKSRIGKKHTEETRRKMREAQRLRRERERNSG